MTEARGFTDSSAGAGWITGAPGIAGNGIRGGHAAVGIRGGGPG
jgi:hypothetical protein